MSTNWDDAIKAGVSRITQSRLVNPELPLHVAQKRKRRSDGIGREPLVILAIDHPARRVTAAGGDPFAMANRQDLLFRIIRVLMVDGVDGLLATPDLMEEVMIAADWLSREHGIDLLSDKLLIGSMNRGGLSGSVFELDDFITAYTAADIERMNLDGGKLLMRIDPASLDSGKTLRYCAEAIRDLAAHHLPAFLEPLTTNQSVDDLIRLVGVATGIGPTTSNLWLKLPMVPDFDRVASATTCPIVLLGGEFPGSTDALRNQIVSSLQAGGNVRGLMIGRSVLYPRDGMDPVDVAKLLAETVQEFVHEGAQS